MIDQVLVDVVIIEDEDEVEDEVEVLEEDVVEMIMVDQDHQ